MFHASKTKPFEISLRLARRACNEGVNKALYITVSARVCGVQLDGGKLPWSLAFKPTEPVLGPTRRAIPPVGGVDVAPIVWVALLSFFNEILLGPQGILNLLQRKLELP